MECTYGHKKEIDTCHHSVTVSQLLGINIFTYVLACAIAFFIGMNVLLGPGWLGSTIGIPGTGTFIEKSASIPSTVDLSESKYLF